MEAGLTLWGKYHTHETPRSGLTRVPFTGYRKPSMDTNRFLSYRKARKKHLPKDLAKNAGKVRGLREAPLGAFPMLLGRVSLPSRDVGLQSIWVT